MLNIDCANESVGDVTTLSAAATPAPATRLPTKDTAGAAMETVIEL
jgi:hypothetical protein